VPLSFLILHSIKLYASLRGEESPTLMTGHA